MSSAELDARRTAAAAVAGDFMTAVGSAPLTRPPDFVTWALRLRDHLVQLLDGLACEPGGLVLDEDQAATVLAALDDAARSIRERAAACPACREHPAELCDETADQLQRAGAYQALAARLTEVTR
jgi:hypothetical protein